MQHKLIGALKPKVLRKVKYNDKQKIYILAVLALILVLLFLFQGLNPNNWDYNISKRIPKIIAIAMTGAAIAFSSIIFQTITNNRILTPSILGLDSIYVFGQTISVFAFGANSLMMNNRSINFLISVVVMFMGTILLYKLVLEKSHNIFLLLLLGTVIGTLFRSISSFLTVLIDPNDFISLQSKLYASFNNIDTHIIFIAAIILILIFFMMKKDLKKLDVMLLGRETSINLGIDHDNLSKKIFFVISLLVSVSTALVGPITFLGLLVVNLAYEFFNTYKHSYLIIGSILISIITLIGGQFVVERVFNFSSTLSIIVNFFGGLYFIYLLIREVKA